jgi:hypothetical protein
MKVKEVPEEYVPLLLNLGFTQDYELKYNSAEWYNFVLDTIPDINKHDFLFVCNKLAKMMLDIDDCCVDNYRLCRSDSKGFWSKEYRECSENGCCGEYDVSVYNTYTKNYFMIGCNYGH